MKVCNKNILKVLEYTNQLLTMADKGDSQRNDDGCGVLYGIIRDSAYKIQNQARQEIDNHKKKGSWDAK